MVLTLCREHPFWASALSTTFYSFGLRNDRVPDDNDHGGFVSHRDITFFVIFAGGKHFLTWCMRSHCVVFSVVNSIAWGSINHHAVVSHWCDCDCLVVWFATSVRPTLWLSRNQHCVMVFRCSQIDCAVDRFWESACSCPWLEQKNGQRGALRTTAGCPVVVSSIAWSFITTAWWCLHDRFLSVMKSTVWRSTCHLEVVFHVT